jgi:hypothetical protein
MFPQLLRELLRATGDDAIPLLFSCILLEPRKVMLAASSLPGLFYSLNILAGTVEPLRRLGNLSIFHYYMPTAIASELSMNWLGIGIYTGIIVIYFTASIYIFQHRDIVV